MASAILHMAALVLVAGITAVMIIDMVQRRR